MDKTDFIKEWWNGGAKVTHIIRPRRFGKTLTMSMVECFFSTRFAGRSDLFEGLKIWEDEEFRKLQGTVPVINISFKNVKEKSYESMIQAIGGVMCNIYGQYRELLESDKLETYQKERCQTLISSQGKMATMDIRRSVKELSEYLYMHYGKAPIILIDEYDTPLLSAYLNGYSSEAINLIGGIFSYALKTNDCLGKAILTGITKISLEMPPRLRSSAGRVFHEKSLCDGKHCGTMATPLGTEPESITLGPSSISCLPWGISNYIGP